MEFVLSFNQPLEEIERHQDPQHAGQALAPWKAYTGAMAAARVMRGGNRLAPPWTTAFG
jgi:hypothetical protein